MAFFKFSFLRGVSVGACADGLPRQDCYEFSERNNLQCPNLFLLFGSVVNVAVHIMGDLAFVKSLWALFQFELTFCLQVCWSLCFVAV